MAHQKYIFCCSDKKKIGVILIHAHWTAIMLAVVTFLFDNAREKRSVPLKVR